MASRIESRRSPRRRSRKRTGAVHEGGSPPVDGVDDSFAIMMIDSRRGDTGRVCIRFARKINGDITVEDLVEKAGCESRSLIDGNVDVVPRSSEADEVAIVMEVDLRKRKAKGLSVRESIKYTLRPPSFCFKPALLKRPRYELPQRVAAIHGGWPTATSPASQECLALGGTTMTCVARVCRSPNCWWESPARGHRVSLVAPSDP